MPRGPGAPGLHKQHNTHARLLTYTQTYHTHTLATTRVPAIEVQEQHIRADICMPQMQVADRWVPRVLHRCFQGSPPSSNPFMAAQLNPSQNSTLRYLDINLAPPSGHKRRLTNIGPLTRQRICVALSSPRLSPRPSAFMGNVSAFCISLPTTRLSFTSGLWMRPSMSIQS